MSTTTNSRAPAHGALAQLYTESGNKRMHELRDVGYTILRSVVDKKKIDAYIARVDASLQRDGFAGRFGAPMGRTMMAKDLPEGFWGIDTVLYVFEDWAIDMRHDMRTAVADALGVDASSLAASFDGVIIKDGKYKGKAASVTLTDVAAHRIPCITKKGVDEGPTHIDQHRFRSGTANSHQTFMPLVVGNLSTILFVPTNGWTLQSVRALLEETFPSHYGASTQPNPKKRTASGTNAKDISVEGSFFPAEHRDFLLARDVCVMVKPKLNPGDLLMWSSAMPHCNGTYATADASRSPRLGMICAFAPKMMLTDEARRIRARVVGGGYATGQQILWPSKHGRDAPSLWKYNPPDKVPRVWHDLKAWRETLKGSPLWAERADDDDVQKKYRARLRDLLGCA